jgi:hypothetical protein
MKGKAMGLLTNLVLGLAHLSLVAADILFLLLFAAMLGYRWQPPWLTAINSAGKPAVDWLTGHIERALDHFTQKPFSERMVLFIGMLGLSILRVFVATCLAR